MSTNPFTKKVQGGGPYYASIPQPYPHQPDSVIMAVTAMKRVIETLSGAVGPTAAHSVTFNTIGDALVYGVTNGKIPPWLLDPKQRGMSSAEVLARISIEVVR